MNRSAFRSAALLALALPILSACGGGDQASGEPEAAPPAPPQLGQAPAVAVDSTKAPVITSFAGFAWGTPKTEIVAKLGEPRETRVQHEGVEALGWDDTVAGQPASRILTVHPQRGLIQGVLQVRPGEKASCQYLYTRLADSVRAAYPALQPEAKTMGNPAGRMCAPNRAEASGAAARWVDPGSGTQLFVAVPPGASSVNVVGITPEGEAWASRGAGPGA